MTRPYLGNPKYTIEVLQKYNFAFQKRFGQNFLIDTHVLEKIIEASKITKDDFFLEIGPGIGTMTQYLAEAAREVVAVEIDKTLIPILENDTLKDWDNVTVINEDILKVDIAALAQEKNGGKPIKVVANLPFILPHQSSRSTLFFLLNFRSPPWDFAIAASSISLTAPMFIGWSSFWFTPIRLYNASIPIWSIL